MSGFEGVDGVGVSPGVAFGGGLTTVTGLAGASGLVGVDGAGACWAEFTADDGLAGDLMASDSLRA